MSSASLPNDPFQLPQAADKAAPNAVPAAPEAFDNMAAPQPPSVAQPAPQYGVGQAQDLDVIEATWVSRVQEVFHRYGNDPRLLSQQFANLKADYIMKRYGKDLRNSSDQKK